MGQAGEAPQAKVGSYTGQAASEELVALLARVETAADTRGGVDQMTFPAALTQSSGGGVANAGDVPAGRFHLQVARFGDVADARRLRDLLRAAEVQAWIAADLEGGVMHWRVAAGGYADPVEADAGLGSLQQALTGWSGPAVDPQVIQR